MYKIVKGKSLPPRDLTVRGKILALLSGGGILTVDDLHEGIKLDIAVSNASRLKIERILDDFIEKGDIQKIKPLSETNNMIQQQGGAING